MSHPLKNQHFVDARAPSEYLNQPGHAYSLTKASDAISVKPSSACADPESFVSGVQLSELFLVGSNYQLPL